MIKQGTKIIMVDGFHIYNKTGPRKGSTGYIIKSKPTCLIPCKRGALFASETRCLFMKYGFERTERKEVRTFINLFPFPYDMPTSIEDLTKFGIEEYSKLRKSETMPMMFYIHGHPLWVGTAVPLLDTKNLKNVCRNEFESWLNSYVTPNAPFFNILKSVCLKGNVSNGLIIQLSMSCKSKGCRNQLLNNIFEHSYLRKEVIETIRMLESVGLMSEYNLHKDRFLKGIYTTNSMITMIHALIDGIYEDSTFSWRTNIISKHSPRLKDKIAYLSEIRDELKYFGQSLSK